MDIWFWIVLGVLTFMGLSVIFINHLMEIAYREGSKNKEEKK